MRKPIIATFFTFLFLVILVTPSVVSLMDLKCDVSILIDVSDDEEGKEGKESSKDKNIKILQLFNYEIEDQYASLSSHHGFYSNTYTSNYLELLSPPPEHRTNS